MSNDLVYIYALIDPDTGMVRYIGKTNDLKRRLKRHLEDKKITYRTNWIKKLKTSGKIPIIKLIEETSQSNWEECEKKWIAFYRIISGKKLTNITEGGECGSKKGRKGHPMSAQTREKLSKINKGRIHTSETRKKHSEDMKRRWADPEYRKNHNKKNIGKIRSKETCKNISEALKKSYQNNPELRKYQSRPETVKKQSETSKKVWTPERKTEHAKILKKLWEDNPELREKQSQISKNMWLNPGHKKLISDLGKKHWEDPELKNKLSVESRERWKSSEYREKRQNTINNKKQGILNAPKNFSNHPVLPRNESITSTSSGLSESNV